VLGEPRLNTRRRKGLGNAAKSMVVAAVALAALMIQVKTASAQNFFEALFGRLLGSAPSAYADPSQQLNPFGRSSDTGGGLAYCVRLCDGRFFPIQRHGGVTPAQACNSFCPASATKIYHGSSIEHAVASDGKRYGELATAFVYRDKIVPDCTCNGKTAFGLVNTPVAEDSTLHPGDIIATNSGLMAYNGGPRAQALTPIASYPALSAELRRQLTETKIEPAAEPTPPQSPVRQAEPAARTGKNKRVQLER
jgi:Protein of unknown function (DUF2865)